MSTPTIMPFSTYPPQKKVDKDETKKQMEHAIGALVGLVGACIFFFIFAVQEMYQYTSTGDQAKRYGHFNNVLLCLVAMAMSIYGIVHYSNAFHF